MSDPTAEFAPDLAAVAQMTQLLEGYMLSQALLTLTEAGVMTVLADVGPLPVQDLAARTGSNVDALTRLVRSLAPHGVFRTGPDGVHVTALGALLSENHPGSLHGIAQGHQRLHYRAMAELPHTLRTGESAALKSFGVPYFQHIGTDPDLARVFGQAMAAFSDGLRAKIFQGYQAPPGTIADVGGGDGSMLVQLLAGDDETTRRGFVLDLPNAVEAARAVLAAAGLAHRVEVVSGDFFETVPTADVYLLSWILHDWDEAGAGRILKCVAQAASSGARLLVVEQVVPEGDLPHPSKAFDMTMLGLLGGSERSQAQYAALMQDNGFTFDRTVPLAAGFSVLEATRG